MAKIKHDRPYLRYNDNLNRVRSVAETWFNHYDNNKKTGNKTSANCTFQFSKDQIKSCHQLLSATETYYENFSNYLENFGNKKKQKINIDVHEENMRESVRGYILECVKEVIGGKVDGPMTKFSSLLSEKIPGDDLLFEMMQQEIEALGNDLDQKIV